MASEPPSQFGTRSTPRPKRKRISYDKFILLVALLIGIPSTAVAELLLWTGNSSGELKWTVTFFLALAWLIGASILQRQIMRPLQTLSNMVASIREEDFSFRVRGGDQDDSLAELTHELNSLADRLQMQKISALEATALLKKVLMEIDVAVFTFDQQQKLRIVNSLWEESLPGCWDSRRKNWASTGFLTLPIRRWRP